MKTRTVVLGFVVVSLFSCGGDGSDPLMPPDKPGQGGSAVPNQGGASTPSQQGGVGVAATGGAGGKPGTITANQLALYKSGTRIKARVGKTPDGSQEFLGWFDSKRNEDCWFSVGADGKKHCFPPAASIAIPVFSDSGCAAPLASAHRCGEAPKYSRGALKAGDTCGSMSSALFTMGEKYDNVLFEKNSINGTCVAAAKATADIYRATFSFFKLGEPVAEAEFQEQTVTIE